MTSFIIPDDNADSDDKNDQFYSGCVKVTPNLGLVEIKNPKSEATDPPKQFTFDAAYNQGSKQKDLYEETFISSTSIGFENGEHRLLNISLVSKCQHQKLILHNKIYLMSCKVRKVFSSLMRHR